MQKTLTNKLLCNVVIRDSCSVSVSSYIFDVCVTSYETD